MRKFTAFTIGFAAGAAATLFVLSRLSEKLGLEREKEDDYSDLDWASTYPKDMSIAQPISDPCPECEGPIHIDGKPRCGHYPDSPVCDNPLKILKEYGDKEYRDSDKDPEDDPEFWRDHDSCCGE